MTYISTSVMNGSMRAAIMASQSDLANAQKELASGTHADIGLTLGGSSGHLVQLSQQQSRLSAYTVAGTVAGTRLTSTASALTSIHGVASGFLTNLVTAASTGGLTTGLKQAAAGNLSSLIGSLNTSVAGEAIFGGINTDATPIAGYAAGSASKQAVDSAFTAAFGFSQTDPAAASITASQMTTFLNGSFAGLFSASSFAGTWSSASDTVQSTEIAPGQSVTSSVSANTDPMRTLAQAYTMIGEFAGAPLSAAAQQAAVTAATALVNKALPGLTDQQTAVGTAQGAIAAAKDQITAQTSLLTTQSSGMTEVDVFTLNTRITSLQTQIQASYELTAQMKKLSLVNYFTA